MGQRVKLRAISDSIPNTGVFGPKGEYPVGTVLTLPDDQPFTGSGYERHELLDGEKTADHVAVVNPADDDDFDRGDSDLSVKRFSAAPTDSPGWWVITDETGAEVGKKVRPSEGAAFNDLDSAGKEKFLAEQG